MTPLEIALSISLSISFIYICYRECKSCKYFCSKREKLIDSNNEYPKNIYIRPNHIELVVSE